MRTRGRPRHPDILTPREQEVLALLRQGLTNPQIAQRLGISLDGAKYHVSEILGKLGVERREDAAQIRLESYRSWWMTAAAPFVALWRRLPATPALPAIAFVLSAAAFAAALGGLAFLGVLLLRGSPSSGSEPIEGVEVMTLEEAQARLLSALSRPGEVLHVTHRDEWTDGTVLNGETWIDIEQDIARVHGPVRSEKPQPALRFLRDGSSWALDERGRLTQAPLGDVLIGEERKSSVLALDYVWTFIVFESEEAKVVAAELDGAPVTVIDVEQHYDADGYDGVRWARLYLDESFLPVRRDHHEQSPGHVSAHSVFYEHEFAPLSSLAEDFFSLEHLRALEVTPADDIARYAQETQFSPYWLGQTFEGMTLHDTREALYFDSIPVLELVYKRGGGGPNDPPPADEPPTGFTIAEFTLEGWQQWSARPSGRSWFLRTGTAEILLDGPEMRVTVYEEPNAHRPPPGPPDDPLPLTPLPEWLGRVAVVETPDAVLLVEPNRGPTYLHDRDALARRATSFRPFPGLDE